MFKKDHNLFQRGYPLSEVVMFIYEHAETPWDERDLNSYREQEAEYFSERADLLTHIFSELEEGAFIKFTEAVIKSGFDLSKHEDTFDWFVGHCPEEDVPAFREALSKGGWDEEFLSNADKKIARLTLAFQPPSSGKGHPSP